MVSREIHRSDGFMRQARHLFKKDRAFETTLDILLNEIATSEKPPVGADQIPGLGGRPVYKIRRQFGNKGKRGGARLIYYCAEALLVPLFVYIKGERSDIPNREILTALESAGLLGGEGTESTGG